MKKTFLLILFLCCTFINAQVTFEKGYFISNNGNRTECLIRNLDWKDNPTDFRYKIDPNDKDYVTETIANVSEFGIGNSIAFKRAKVKIDRSTDDLSKISQTGKPVWEESTLFLRVLVTGEASLYSYREANLFRYFYETKEVPLEQLVYLRYIETQNENASKNIKENTYYKQQLNLNVRSANITDNDIKGLSYNKSDLTKYFVKYNNVPEKKEKKEQSTESKSQYFIKVTAAASPTSLSITSSSLPYRNAKIDSKTLFKVGIEAEFVLPFNNNKWSIFTNPMYQKYENNKSYSLPGLFPTSPVENHTVDISYTAVQVPIGVRHYLFLNKSSKLFINAAFAFDVATKATITYDEDIRNDSKTGTNLAFGFGYNFKNKISAEARFNTKKELMADYRNFSAKYNTLDLVIAYTIF
jgi:hypothetical protein